MKLLPTFLAGLGFAVLVAAAEEPQVDFDKATLHIFGGQNVKIAYSAEGPLGSKADVRASLFQKAQSLAAPLQKDIPMGEQISFATQTWKRIVVSLPIPKVKRKTQIVAEIEVKGTGDWHVTGQIDFVVYPPDSLKKELQELVGATHLEVFGNDKRLGPFLEKQEVETDDIGIDLPGRPEAGRLYVGVARTADLAQWLDAHSTWEGSLVVFCEDSELLPGAFSEFRGRGCLAKVTLPLLDNLSSDPLCQKTFTAVLASILNHQTP